MRAILVLLFATTAGVALADEMAAGSYQCWYFNQARLTLNFTVTGAGTYTGYDDSPGTYSVDSNGTVTFLSRTLEGIMPDGFVAKYEVRGGTPTLSYISGRGAEATFCERA